MFKIFVACHLHVKRQRSQSLKLRLFTLTRTVCGAYVVHKTYCKFMLVCRLFALLTVQKSFTLGIWSRRCMCIFRVYAADDMRYSVRVQFSILTTHCEALLMFRLECLCMLDEIQRRTLKPILKLILKEHSL